MNLPPVIKPCSFKNDIKIWWSRCFFVEIKYMHSLSRKCINVVRIVHKRIIILDYINVIQLNCCTWDVYFVLQTDMQCDHLTSPGLQQQCVPRPVNPKACSLWAGCKHRLQWLTVAVPQQQDCAKPHWAGIPVRGLPRCARLFPLTCSSDWYISHIVA